MPKSPRASASLKLELRDQIELLTHACKAYDDGLESIGKHISVSLRVLLHHHNRSRALLEQLKIRDGFFLDSAGPISSTNLLAECNLVGVSVMGGPGSGTARYMTLAQMGGGARDPRRIPFTPWWIQPVMKDAAGNRFSRLELVTGVADADGGAHVDPALDEAYMRMSREYGLGWDGVFGNINGSTITTFSVTGRLELACMRQIGWEVLETLKLRAPEFFQSN